MCDLTRYHAQRAGVDKYIKVSCSTASKVLINEENGMIITNPPYGMRLEDKAIASELNALCKNFALWQKYILTSNKNIEREIGIYLSKKRRVYNGNIECNFLLFENNKK
jgi:putative N6-adenine-specific DNA methylase